MSENVLTNRLRSGNIIKLSARETPKDREEYEELQKSLKKHLTKSKRCDIILKLSQRSEQNLEN